MERFVCHQCGHHFEAEPAESLICPNCYWSTSVTKEGEKPAPKKVETPAPEIPSKPPRLWFWAGILALLLIVSGIGVLVVRYLQNQTEILQKIKSKNAQVIATEAPELALLPEEREVLSRRISLEPTRPLSPGEREILGRRFPFGSRIPQGIPQPPWTEKEFDTFLKGEERHYKLSLEWTYKRKLRRLFREHYLVATQAFEAKEYLKGRDEWIRALAFPVYYEDIKKHRGVILTMLRPYINDVLSKIGAMNALLVGKDLYATEEGIRTSYNAFYDLLQKESWEEAGAKLLELQKELVNVERMPQAAAPPPLPREVVLVDSDIREVLLSQVVPAQPTLPDWEALRKNLAEKEKIIQGRLPSTLEAIKKDYEEALLLIENKNWAEARERLERIEFPEEFREDAREKIAILSKLTGEEGAVELTPSLDSQGKTG